MGYGGIEILQMIFFFFFITFMLISLQCTTHILISDNVSPLNLTEDFNPVHGGTKKVSGNDESEEKPALIFEKVRVLLGIKGPQTGVNSNGSVNGSPFPSPSPSPTTEAPAPVPMPPSPIHVHAHPPLPSHHPPSHKQIHKNDSKKGKFTRVVVAGVVSGAATFVVCVLGLIWFCRKFRKHRKRSPKRRSILKGSKGKDSVNKKVSFNPGMDLFYLNSIDLDLEQHASSTCLKQENKASPSNFASNDERKESEQLQEIKSESGNTSSSSNPCGIVSAHENSEETIRYEFEGGNESSNGDEIIHVQYHSSDDESFHSFCDSHSSVNNRLSNASASSFSDALMENLSSNSLENLNTTMESSANLPIQMTSPASNPISCPSKSLHILDRKNGPCSLKSHKNFISPPPPPPPPPPPQVHCSPIYSSSSSSVRINAKALHSSTLPNLTSPRKSSSSSGSNQTPQNDSPSSPPNPPSKPTLSPMGVPPPPPPPFLKGNGNSIKNPPPLPSQFTPLGKDGAPLPKLKPLHWDKVRAASDRSMVWDSLRSSSFELDEEMMESLFGYSHQNSMNNDEAKSKTPSPSKHVLDPKRLQNITILSKALNVTADQVCGALLQGEGLCLQQLEALAKMVPTKEEEDKLFSYKGDINELGSAERFVKAMLDTPFAFLRIEAMLYRETFEDEVVYLRKSLSVLEEACKELRSSRLFLKLLEAVLKTGNRMNVGTIRGGARAFKLDALLKLSDVKGTDGKTTLLHFVVQEMIRSEGIKESETIVGRMNQRRKTIEEREEDYRRMGLDLVSGISNELCNVKKTATIDLDVLASSVSNLSDGMSKLQNLVKNDTSEDQNNGKFVCTMRSFLGYAEKNLKELQEYEHKVLAHVREITEYFHGKMSKDEANPLRIFVIVRDFLGVLDHVCKELKSSKIPSSPNPLAPFR